MSPHNHGADVADAANVIANHHSGAVEVAYESMVQKLSGKGFASGGLGLTCAR